MLFAAMLMGIIIIVELVEIFKFISQTNRKLTRFLESVRYSDFISGFAADNRLGKSFKELNIAFNEVSKLSGKHDQKRKSTGSIWIL